MKGHLISVVLICALAAVPLRAAESAPTSPITTLDGAPLSLDSLKGKVVVLDFWATWCAPCRASFPFLDALQAKYDSRGLGVVGLTLEDNKDAIIEFLQAIPVRFTIITTSWTRRPDGPRAASPRQPSSPQPRFAPAATRPPRCSSAKKPAWRSSKRPPASKAR